MGPLIDKTDASRRFAALYPEYRGKLRGAWSLSGMRSHTSTHENDKIIGRLSEGLNMITAQICVTTEA